MIKKNYGCSEPDLYTICRLIWLLCQQHLAEFGNYKSKYTTAFVDDNLTLIKTVEGLTEHNTHAETIKSSREDVGAEQSEAAVFFKQTKGYIKEAYADDETLRDAQIIEAGQSNFTKVSRGNWREVKGLYSAMIRFVQNYETELITKGYMPTGFLARIQTSQAAFETAHQNYKTGSAAKPDAVEAKIIANNNLKDRASALLADGQIVFADDKAIADKFTWTTIMSEVRGSRPSGVTGFITDADTKEALTTATVSIAALDKTIVVNDKGQYEWPLAVGKYDMEFKAEGYASQIVKGREVKADVMGRSSVALVPIKSA